MNEYQSLLVRAAECEQLANEARDESVRAELEELATEFLRLAYRAKMLEAFSCD